MKKALKQSFCSYNVKMLPSNCSIHTNLFSVSHCFTTRCSTQHSHWLIKILSIGGRHPVFSQQECRGGYVGIKAEGMFPHFSRNSWECECVSVREGEGEGEKERDSQILEGQAFLSLNNPQRSITPSDGRCFCEIAAGSPSNFFFPCKNDRKQLDRLRGTREVCWQSISNYLMPALIAVDQAQAHSKTIGSQITWIKKPLTVARRLQQGSCTSLK